MKPTSKTSAKLELPKIDSIEALDADIAALEAEIKRKERNKINSFFPATGPLRRELYPKHVEFFAAGAKYKERLFMAANRVGKSESGAYEVACHLTGIYPPWWAGRRFTEPVEVWACGTTSETTRDIVQAKLLGKIEALGTGMIPGDRIVNTTPRRSGLAGAIESAWIKHVSGKSSVLGMKCHPAGSKVLMADGSWQNIESLILGDSIRCPDGQPRKVTQVWSYADSPVLKVSTRSGSVRCTPNHPLHTENSGWQRAEHVRVGDVLTIASADHGQNVRQEEWKVCLTALMIGDGCMRSATPFFTCNEQPIVDMVKAILPPEMSMVRVNGTISYKIYSSLHKENRLKDSLVADGLWGHKSTTKFLPAWVFRLPVDQRKLFLRWLFGCDGTINTKTATYSTSSPRLAQDVRLLLWSLGMYADVKVRHVTCNGKPFISYDLPLYGANRVKFQEIGKLNRNPECSITPRPKGPYGEVMAIEKEPNQNVYCVGVEDVHELIVEGYRVGNTYEQGRSSFEGTSKHVIWCDEEPDLDVYTEMLYRTLTTKGVVLTTFTPLQGMSDVVKSFLEPETEEAKEFKWYIQAGWNDVPHIPDEERRALIATTPPYQIKARTEGEPSLGAGAIYPIAESEITCDPFPIPDDWPRAYGFDCGWRKTAAIFGARDPSGIVYLYSEHYQGQGEPASHALAIRGRGEYICGVIDPASLGSSQIDGRNLLDIYRDLGLNLERANNSVESGILKVWQMLVSGQLKVMKNCQNWLSEFRKYHRKDNEKGTVKKVDDHLMDATRYLVMSGLERMRAVPTKRTSFSTRPAWRGTTSSWMN